MSRRLSRSRRILLVSAVVVAGWYAAVTAAWAGIGDPAQDFTLTDSNGASHTLSDYDRHFVVLEWFNHDCPFVRKHYDSGNMQQLQATSTERGVIWLTIISSAPGQQGYVLPEQANAILKDRQSKQTALLLDPDGTVGRLYGAKTTPHLFIIDPEGRLIYAGAIDETPSTDPADIPGATNYVQQALDEALAGGPVSIPETKSYGCSVKY